MYSFTTTEQCRDTWLCFLNHNPVTFPPGNQSYLSLSWSGVLSPFSLCWSPHSVHLQCQSAPGGSPSLKRFDVIGKSGENFPMPASRALPSGTSSRKRNERFWVTALERFFFLFVSLLSLFKRQAISIKCTGMTLAFGYLKVEGDLVWKRDACCAGNDWDGEKLDKCRFKVAEILLLTATLENSQHCALLKFNRRT